MWRKSDDLRTQLEQFVLEPTESPRVNNTFCHVYLMEDLTFSLPLYGLDLAGFRDAMRVERSDSPSLPLDDLFPTQDGYVARHLSMNNPTMELVALRWWRTGNVRLTIPINFIQRSPYRPVQDPLFKTFVEIMGQTEYGSILNMDQWLFVLLTLMMRYVDLRDKLQSKDRSYGKIVFSNALTATPFIGME